MIMQNLMIANRNQRLLVGMGKMKMELCRDLVFIYTK